MFTTIIVKQVINYRKKVMRAHKLRSNPHNNWHLIYRGLYVAFDKAYISARAMVIDFINYSVEKANTSSLQLLFL